MFPYNVSPLMLIYIALFAVFVVCAVFLVRVWRKPIDRRKKALVTVAVLVALAAIAGVVYCIASRAISEFYEMFRDFKI